jgi:two-component system NtrC family sensor kinase
LKWLSRGTLLTVLPFTALYVIPFLADRDVPNALTKIACALADPAAADLQLGDRALPADGRGPDLQARRDLHAGDRRAGGALLRCDRATAEMVHQRFQSLREWGLVAIIVWACPSIR